MKYEERESIKHSSVRLKHINITYLGTEHSKCLFLSQNRRQELFEWEVNIKTSHVTLELIDFITELYVLKHLYY